MGGGNHARAADVAAAARKPQEASADTFELKGFSPSSAPSIAEAVVFPPLQLRWRLIFRALLLLLPRKPRTIPQGLTPPLLPREPQLTPLSPALVHNQRRAPLPLRGWGPPLFRAPYLLRKPLPRTLESTHRCGSQKIPGRPARRCCRRPSRGGCGPFRRGDIDHLERRGLPGRQCPLHSGVGQERVFQYEPGGPGRCSSIGSAVPATRSAATGARRRTGPVSYFTKNLTVIVRALCDALRSTHASISERVLWPSPSEYADDLANQAANINCARDGGGGDGGSRDRRGGCGSDGRDRRVGNSGRNHHGGAGHSSGVEGTDAAWDRRTAAREGATAGLLEENRDARTGWWGWIPHLGPTLRLFVGGGSWDTSP